MTQFTDYFKPEVLFSRENPFLKPVAVTHRAIFDTLDKAARVQLAFAEDLLDMNRERFELLYAGKSFTETLDAQQDLITDLSRRTAQYAGDLQDIATSLGSGLTEVATDAANDTAKGAGRKSGSTKSKKAA